MTEKCPRCNEEIGYPNISVVVVCKICTLKTLACMACKNTVGQHHEHEMKGE